MPHATMQLIPGVDTNETPALNQAGFSQSQLVRFIADRTGKGLVQKLGGWVNWAKRTYTSAISELRPWEDISATARLAVGAANELSYVVNGTLAYNNITPEITSSNVPLTSQLSQAVTAVVAGVTNTIATSLNWGTFTPVFFTAGSGGVLPSGITANQVYYIINSNASTFQIATTQSGPAVSLVTTGTLPFTVSVATVSVVANSPTVTIVDTNLGYLSSVSFTNASPTVVTGTAPTANTKVIFRGGSLPTGITAGTAYYAQPLTSNTFSLTDNPTTGTSYNYINTTTTGTGSMYAPDQIRPGFAVNIQTPISIQNLFLNGIYTATSYLSNNFFSIYTITAPINATAASVGVATSNANGPLLPTFGFNSGSTTVLVTEYNQPYIQGQTIAFLYPTTYAGSTVSGNYIIQTDSSYSSSTYDIIVSTPPSSSATVSMNSGSIHFGYYFNLPSLYSAGGYGTGGYGYGGYGIGTAVAYPSAPALSGVSDWTINNFGEILVANPQGGPIYYWSPSNNTATAQLLATAPLANQGIFVAMPARQVVAYGSTATGVQDPLLIRWSDVSDATNWTASANNQAGSYRIPEGSLIVGAIQGPQQALIWTDLAVWSMQYTGLPFVYGFNKLADGTGLIGKKAMGLMEGVTYWMSQQKFMMLTSSGPTSIQCPVWDKVFQNINTGLYPLIRCATNSTFGEVTWYYPSATATANDSYVRYNINTQQWDYGSLDRVAWTDQSVLGTPIGASSGGIIYQHEMGYNNGTDAMVSSFQTGYIQLNEANSMVFVDQIWPDFKFTTGGGGTGGITAAATVYVTFYGANYPGDTPTVYGPYTVTQNTEYISTRIRNRLLSIGVSTADSNGVAGLNQFFRIGAMRYRFQLDGKF